MQAITFKTKFGMKLYLEINEKKDEFSVYQPQVFVKEIETREEGLSVIESVLTLLNIKRINAEIKIHKCFHEEGLPCEIEIL